MINFNKRFNCLKMYWLRLSMRCQKSTELLSCQDVGIPEILISGFLKMKKD